MKLKGLLLLLLLLAVLLPLTAIFQSASVTETGYAGIGNSVVVVAKESYVYARVQILVQPLVNNTNVVVYGGQIQPARFTFPNGTSVTVTKPTTFTIVLSNDAFIGAPATWATGPGYTVSPGSPLSVQVLSGQNATSNSIPGIDMFHYTVSGDYELSVQALGVSL
ncbi:MAG: hypothetical protein ACLQEQ_08650 [Nitrososphaerales archaeon]